MSESNAVNIMSEDRMICKCDEGRQNNICIMSEGG